MKFKYLLIAGLILAILMIGAVSASDANDTIGTEDQQNLADSPKTFTELEIDINASDDTFDVQDNYTFNSESDKGYVEISKSDFTINESVKFYRLLSNLIFLHLKFHFDESSF